MVEQGGHTEMPSHKLDQECTLILTNTYESSERTLEHLREQEEMLYNWKVCRKRKKEKGKENWKMDRSVPLRGSKRKEGLYSENPTPQQGVGVRMRSLGSCGQVKCSSQTVKGRTGKTYAQSPVAQLRSDASERSWVVKQAGVNCW